MLQPTLSRDLTVIGSAWAASLIHAIRTTRSIIVAHIANWSNDLIHLRDSRARETNEKKNELTIWSWKSIFLGWKLHCPMLRSSPRTNVLKDDYLDEINIISLGSVETTAWHRFFFNSLNFLGSSKNSVLRLLNHSSTWTEFLKTWNPFCSEKNDLQEYVVDFLKLLKFN